MYNLDGREKLHYTKLHGLNTIICSPESDLKAAMKFKTKLLNLTQIRLSRNQKTQSVLIKS